jgi:hypothetical protein
MRNKNLLAAFLILFSTNMTIAQTDKNKMSDTQKIQAAKADVYIIDSKKKITDSLTTNRDTTAAKKTKKKSCIKGNKKSS